MPLAVSGGFGTRNCQTKNKSKMEHKKLNTTQNPPLQQTAVISWVAVTERLPEIPSENYLVVKNGIVDISLFRGDWNKFQCDLHDIQEVTHWAECPKPPCH